MGDINPSTREEVFMKGIANVMSGNSSGVSIAPSSRTEYFLNEILEAASGGGGGGALVVNFGGNSGLTPDKTTAEIAAAATAGQLVVFKWSLDGGVFIAIANITLSNGSMTGAKASAVNDNYDGMMSTMKYESGSWSETEKYLS